MNEKVKTLEQAKPYLEKKIRDFYNSKKENIFKKEFKKYLEEFLRTSIKSLEHEELLNIYFSNFSECNDLNFDYKEGSLDSEDLFYEKCFDSGMFEVDMFVAQITECALLQMGKLIIDSFIDEHKKDLE